MRLNLKDTRGPKYWNSWPANYGTGFICGMGITHTHHTDARHSIRQDVSIWTRVNTGTSSRDHSHGMRSRDLIAFSVCKFTQPDLKNESVFDNWQVGAVVIIF